MDILKQDTRQSREKAVVTQRDIMGLVGKTFRGKDSRYEYSASPPKAPASSASSVVSSSSNKSKQQQQQRSHRNRVEISTYMGTGDQTSYLEAVLNNEVVRGSYLESLLSTEDGSHPDKDMVLLWCMRNGIEHMEVSALDGKYDDYWNCVSEWEFCCCMSHSIWCVVFCCENQERELTT
jgi:hypothetical protein